MDVEILIEKSYKIIIVTLIEGYNLLFHPSFNCYHLNGAASGVTSDWIIFDNFFLKILVKYCRKFDEAKDW
jgi:hypothetical protein